MSFLDRVPQDWTRPELPELRDLFVLAYRRPTATEQLAERAGIVPGTFPHHHDMRTTWTELLKEMGSQARLRALVKEAADDPAAAAYRPRFLDMLGSAPAVATPQPSAAAVDWWKGDDRAPAVAGRIYPERLLERRSRLMKIALAGWVTAAARSVAKLSLRFGDKPGHGTGFLISDKLILTNHHNMFHEEHGPATSVVAEFDYEENYDEKLRGKPLVRRALIDTIVGARDHDWAVIRTESPVDRPPLMLGTPYDIGVDDTVVIIQHPSGAFKQFSLEPLAIRYADDRRIQYIADTQQGSSGSPVFNSRMHVIALHHAEAEATVEIDGRAEVVWRNQGVHIAQVMKALRRHRVKFARNE